MNGIMKAFDLFVSPSPLSTQCGHYKRSPQIDAGALKLNDVSNGEAPWQWVIKDQL